MTENEKAKAYDEALKKASAAHKDEDRHLKATLERIFPELKEDDDERIKKDLIQWVDEFPDIIWRGHYKEDIIAWLEKQGDKLIQELGEYKVKYTQEVLEKYITSMSNKDNERLRKITIAFLKDFAEQGYENAVECIDWLEKQGEMHLWTIQDAKDGDVIFYDEGWTCIFKCIHGIWYSSYCFITDDGEFHTGYERHSVDSTIHGNAHLATKEQRDLLFQKIKEAGYEWDADKKELKKLVKPKFDPKTLKPFDKVICKNGLDIWCCDFFSSYIESYVCKNVCISRSYLYCIPYNDETKHLVGTTDEAPEYYRYWEE